VHPQARVIGPVYIGAGTKVLADAVIIGPAVIGENCEIAGDAVVHESILWNESRVGRGAMVEQAVVAQKAVVAPNVEVRGSIVLDTALSSAERTSLSGSSDLSPQELTGQRWWSRLWRGFKPPARSHVGVE
jgi:mannose-1-phosphate guanylyltransferase